MKKALIVLALVISSPGLKAQESQVPFKVGDVVRLCEPTSAQQFPNLVLVVKKINGKWVSGGGTDIRGEKGEIYHSNTWYNTERYLYIGVNEEEDLKQHGIMRPTQIPTQNTNTTPTYSMVDGKVIYNPISPKVDENTNTSTNIPPLRKRNSIPIPTDENAKKDSPQVGEKSK